MEGSPDGGWAGMRGLKGGEAAQQTAQNGTKASRALVCSHRLSSRDIFRMSLGGSVWRGGTEGPYSGGWLTHRRARGSEQRRIRAAGTEIGNLQTGRCRHSQMDGVAASTGVGARLLLGSAHLLAHSKLVRKGPMMGITQVVPETRTTRARRGLWRW